MPLSTWPTYPDDLLCSSPDDVPQGCDFSGDEVQVASADYPAPPLTTLSLGSSDARSRQQIMQIREARRAEWSEF